RNPPELGHTAREIKRVKNGRYYEIPASDTTRGHGTSGDAKYWKEMLRELLAGTPGQGRIQHCRLSPRGGSADRAAQSFRRSVLLIPRHDRLNALFLLRRGVRHHLERVLARALGV